MNEKKMDVEGFEMIVSTGDGMVEIDGHGVKYVPGTTSMMEWDVD